MVIVDSSALLAVIFAEEDEPRFTEAMIDASALHMSAVNWVETAIVVDARKKPDARLRFEELISLLRLEIVPVTATDAHLARAAYNDYGRGRHRARLNFGDCFAYALAKSTEEPLLFKGTDFSHTDIEPALKD